MALSGVMALLLLQIACAAGKRTAVAAAHNNNNNNNNAGTPLPVSSIFTPAPKLVVGIVVDQMRPDYVYRYWDKLGDRGFKRLLKEGFECQNAQYNYVPTYTAPGHTSIYTGTTPAVHGIISNNWYLRDQDRETYCTEDDSEKTVGSTTAAGQMSPRNMLTTTITDELRLFSNEQSKVVGISIKDRGAILPAGHLGTAYWLDAYDTWGEAAPQKASFITSTYYKKELPEWVKKFNALDRGGQLLSKPWQTLLPIEQYSRQSLPDNTPYEAAFMAGQAPVFPYNLPDIAKNKGWGIIRSTPFGNTLLKEFAVAAIEGEQLGKGAVTDFISISFSSPDYIGHRFGTRAIETEDTYLRLDQDIAELLDFLDSHVGLQNVLLFLTADHAAAEVAQFLIDKRVPAGYFDPAEPISQLKARYYKQYGDSLVSSYSNSQIFLDRTAIARKGISLAAAQSFAADFMLQFKGVAQVQTADQLQKSTFTDRMRQIVQNGYHIKRSGDVLITLEPAWMEYENTGTTHGTEYNYDTKVPLIWFGGGVKTGKTARHINITDIAPTLAVWLNLPFPNGCTGEPIVEILNK